MKKSLLLPLAALLILSGCANPGGTSSMTAPASAASSATLNAAQQLYAAALANHKALEYIDATVTTDIITGGETTHADQKIQVVHPNGPDTLVYMSVEKSGVGGGQTYSGQMEYGYYKDGWVYIEEFFPAQSGGGNSTKVKVKKTAESYLTAIWLPEAADLQNAALDGVAITADCPAFARHNLSFDDPGTVTSEPATVVVQNGQIVSIHQKMSGPAYPGSADITQNEITVTFQNIGQPVTVTLPTDLDSYTIE